MTRFVRQKYMYFVDMETKSDTLQIINITAGGLMPQARLKPFFAAFKYFKLGKVSLRFVPAATLPVDPTGLSYEAGEQTVDPRDQMNPGLVRITNGEDITELASILTGAGAERAYYATMLDPRWYKFQLQRGFKRTAKPLLWNVGQTHQNFGQTLVAAKNLSTGGIVQGSTGTEFGLGRVEEAGSSTPTMGLYNSGGESGHEALQQALMQTGRVRMGWMPTDMFDAGLYGPAPVPEVNLVTVVLPKAYKTKYFYRCYIEEEILFRDPVATYPIYSTFTNGSEGLEPMTQFNWTAFDRYVIPQHNVPNSGSGNSAGTYLLNNGSNLNNGGSSS